MKSRRRRYYYQIHLPGRVVIDGEALYSGMLEAERVVAARALELSEQLKRPGPGYMIMRKSLLQARQRSRDRD